MSSVNISLAGNTINHALMMLLQLRGKIFDGKIMKMAIIHTRTHTRTSHDITVHGMPKQLQFRYNYGEFTWNYLSYLAHSRTNQEHSLSGGNTLAPASHQINLKN